MSESVAAARCRSDEARAYVAGLEMLGMRFGLDRVRALCRTRWATRSSPTARSTWWARTASRRPLGSSPRILRAARLSRWARTSRPTWSASRSGSWSTACRRPTMSSTSWSPASSRSPTRSRPAFAEGEVLTQFEVLTAAAFLFFKEQECDVAVIEAGLGGRWDATSIIRSDVQVVTTHRTGAHRAAGRDDAGHPGGEGRGHPPGGQGHGRPPRAGRARPTGRPSAPSGARRSGSSGRTCRCSWAIRPGHLRCVRSHDLYANLRLSVLGSYQRTNAAVAIGAAELFLGGALDSSGVARGARDRPQVPGRLEVISAAAPLHPRRSPQSVRHGRDGPLARPPARPAAGDRRGVDPPRQGCAGDACAISRLAATSCSSPRTATPARIRRRSWPRCWRASRTGPEVFVDRDPRSALHERLPAGELQPGRAGDRLLYLISDLKRSLGGHERRPGMTPERSALHGARVARDRRVILRHRLRDRERSASRGVRGEPLPEHPGHHRSACLDAGLVLADVRRGASCGSSLVFWTLKDARKRIEDRPDHRGRDGALLWCSRSSARWCTPSCVRRSTSPTCGSASSRCGRWRLELRAVRACPNCREPVREDYVVCPKCRKSLRRVCADLRPAGGVLVEGLPVLCATTVLPSRRPRRSSAGRRRRSQAEATRGGRPTLGVMRRPAAALLGGTEEAAALVARCRERGGGAWRERTLVLVKPNGVARGLVGEVVARFERRGSRLTGTRAAGGRPRARRAALRGARGQGLLRGPGVVHHLGTHRGHGGGGDLGGQGGPRHDGSHEPHRRGAGHYPGRLRSGDRRERRPRLGQRRERRA